MKKAIILALMAATAAAPALAKGPKHGGGKGHEARAERHEERKEHKQELRAERHHDRAEHKFERRGGDFGFGRHAVREARKDERGAPEFLAERHWDKREKHFERRAQREHRRAERHVERADKHEFKAERKFAKQEAKFERKLHKQEVKFERKLAKADGRDFAIERRLRMRQAAAPRDYYQTRERRYAYAQEPVFAAGPAAAYQLYAPRPAYDPAYGGDYYGREDSYPGVSYGDSGLGSLLGGGGMSGILTALLPVFLQQAGLGDLGGLGGGLGGLGGLGDVAGLGGSGGDPASGYDPAYQDYAGAELARAASAIWRARRHGEPAAHRRKPARRRPRHRGFPARRAWRPRRRRLARRSRRRPRPRRRGRHDDRL
jgi:hypothetical protein